MSEFKVYVHVKFAHHVVTILEHVLVARDLFSWKNLNSKWRLVNETSDTAKGYVFRVTAEYSIISNFCSMIINQETQKVTFDYF